MNIKKIFTSFALATSLVTVAVAQEKIIEQKVTIEDKQTISNHILKINDKKIFAEDLTIGQEVLETFIKNGNLTQIQNFTEVYIIYNELVLQSNIYNKLKLGEAINKFRKPNGQPLNKMERKLYSLSLWKDATIKLVQVDDKTIENYYYSHLPDFDKPSRLELYFFEMDTEKEFEEKIKFMRYTETPKVDLITLNKRESKKFGYGYISKEELYNVHKDSALYDNLDTLDENTTYSIPFYSKETGKYYLFYVGQKLKSKKVTLEKASPEIKQIIQKELFLNQIREFLDSYKKKNSIKYNMEYLNSIGKK